MYAYMKRYICMICIYLTEKVNRLKLARLHTRASNSAKIYTIDKFSTKSSQMARKRIHNFHNILWNAYCYLKRRIMGFDRYLHTRILSWRNRKPLATPTPPPPGMVYIRRTGIVECQNGSIHSHSMHLGPLVWAPRSLVTTVLSRQGQPTQQGGSLSSSWQPVVVLPIQAGLPRCLCHLDLLQLLHLWWNLWEV